MRLRRVCRHDCGDSDHYIVSAADADCAVRVCDICREAEGVIPSEDRQSYCCEKCFDEM